MLSEELELTGDEVISLVGGGGKTTTMFRLASELKCQQFKRIITTTTTKIFKPTTVETEEVIIDSDFSALYLAMRSSFAQIMTVGKGINQQNKLLGLTIEEVDQLQQLTSPSEIPIIVEADGAACRDFKIPNYEEPLLPASTDLLVPLVGSRIVGRELTAQYLHRVELLSEITTEFKVGDQVTSQLIVEILCSSAGYNLLAELEKREVIPIINQVENEARYQFGVEVANRLIERGVNKVLLTKVEHDQPIVEVLQK